MNDKDEYPWGKPILFPGLLSSPWGAAICGIVCVLALWKALDLVWHVSAMTVDVAYNKKDIHMLSGRVRELEGRVRELEGGKRP